MDNWLFLLLGLLLGIPFSIFANFATPWVKSAYERSLLSSKLKRIDSLISQYRKAKVLKDNPLEFGYYALIKLLGLLKLMVVLLFSGLVVIWFAQTALPNIPLANISVAIGLLGYGIVSGFSFLSFQQEIRTLRRFDAYKENTIAQLKKLGGNPEDLDEIDQSIKKHK